MSGNVGSWFGLSESNSLVRMGIIPTLSVQGILAPGSGVIDDVKAFMRPPEMPAVPESTFVADTTAADKAAREAAETARKASILRRGRSSTILAGDTLGNPQTKKATLLGG